MRLLRIFTTYELHFDTETFLELFMKLKQIKRLFIVIII